MAMQRVFSNESSLHGKTGQRVIIKTHRLFDASQCIFLRENLSLPSRERNCFFSGPLFLSVFKSRRLYLGPRLTEEYIARCYCTIPAAITLIYDEKKDKTCSY